MPKNKKNINLFSPSGCLRLEAIQQYISNKITLYEKQAVEEHLSSCELCRDACEGLRHFTEPKKISRTIHKIDNQIHRGIERRFNYRDNRKGRDIVQRKTFFYSAAASVLLIIGFLTYLNVEKNYDKPVISELNEKEDQYSEKEDHIILHDPVDQAEKNREDKPSKKKSLIDKEKSTKIGSRKVKSPEEKSIRFEVADEIKITKNDIDVEQKELPEQLFNAGSPKNETPSKEMKMTRQMAQSSTSILAESESEKEVFMIVEDMPKFKGKGLEEFIKYVQNEIKYPEKAAENEIQGKVMIQFVINKEGKTEHVSVMRSVDSLLDYEALRVVKSSPKWTPGKQRGKPVKVKMVIPVEFTLQ